MSRFSSKLFQIVLLMCAGLAALVTPSAGAGFIQLDGAMDVKTRFSEGCSTAQELAEEAKQKGIDVLFYNDSARNSLEYGLVPLERILKKKEERSSVLSVGANAYLSEIGDLDRHYREVLLIPGVEAMPFYFWTGGILKRDLVANNFDKRLLIYGMETAPALEQLPLLNSNFSKRMIGKYQTLFSIYGGLFLFSCVLIYKRFYRKLSMGAAAVFFLLAVNNHPFQSSPYDQYHGDQGVEPYQKMIDRVKEQGGMTFWNRLDALNGMREVGSVQLKTLPHPEDLVLSKGYDGFQAVADQPLPHVDPGQEWDQVLGGYLSGERPGAVWGIGTNDYRCAAEDGKILGMVRTVFLVREKSREGVMEALKKGRMYAVRQPDADRLSLDDFTVSDVTTGQVATLGEEISVSDFPEIRANLRSLHGEPKSATLRIVRNGAVVKEEAVNLPYEMVWRDVEVPREGPVYYRLSAWVGPTDHLVANPVFVRFVAPSAEVASLPPSGAVPPGGPKSPSMPRPPSVSMPSVPSPGMPQAGMPSAGGTAMPRQPGMPGVSIPSVPQPGMGEGYSVVTLVDSVPLKKGPGTIFPDVVRVDKGTRLEVVRKTTVRFNRKPWLVVRWEGQNAFVWEGVVQTE
ncbi:MAG: hypothetical protein COV67_08705 [Nitrospinae bacterium CG11_big_fil_rev_8_21_14_0_20_56_8]|nr:MAG: hypothetical protein COV67_08705 [Nitrospinae bacterium CG11_big_fil_rev_8_21_14_0_20_56_8]